MKLNPHVFALDDAPFTKEQSFVPVVGVLVRAPMYVEKVVSSRIARDGTDATDVLADMAAENIRRTATAILIDGICLGGFNVVDIELLADTTGLPVMSVTEEEPDLASMENALRKHFPDWERRMGLIRRIPLSPIKAKDRTLHCCLAGCTQTFARELLERTMVQGSVPEPIRLAHVIAGGTLDGRVAGQ